jgi:hypothetical protein
LILATDAALATLTAALLFAIYALGKSIRSAIAILLPFAAAVLTFPAVFAALALFSGLGAASGGVGHTPTATTIVQVTILAVAAGMGLIASVFTARVADRWAPPVTPTSSPPFVRRSAIGACK